MTSSPHIEALLSDSNRCGEAPIWDSARQRLLWTDIPADIIYTFDPASNTKTILHRGLNVAGIALNEPEGLILAGATGLHRWSEQLGHRVLISSHGGQPLLFNDIIASPLGSIYAGTVYWGPSAMEKPGALYLIHPDCRVEMVDDSILLSNGLAFSVDNRTLYYADSAARTIYAYDVHLATGALSNRRTFLKVPVDDGIPDGLTVDSEDHLWCVMWYGGQVIRYDPTSHIERRIQIPARQTSSLAFGGPDLTDLFITTAAEAWPSDLAPSTFRADDLNMGGSLFRIRLRIRGKPEHHARFC